MPPFDFKDEHHSDQYYEEREKRSNSGFVVNPPTSKVVLDIDDGEESSALNMDLSLTKCDVPNYFSTINITDEEKSDTWFRFLRVIMMEFDKIPMNEIKDHSYDQIKWIPFDFPWKKYLERELQEQVEKYFLPHKDNVYQEYNKEPVDILGNSYKKSWLKEHVTKLYNQGKNIFKEPKTRLEININDLCFKDDEYKGLLAHYAEKADKLLFERFILKLYEGGKIKKEKKKEANKTRQWHLKHTDEYQKKNTNRVELLQSTFE